MRSAFNAIPRKAITWVLALLLVMPLGTLAGCATSTPAVPSPDEAAVISDDYPPMKQRTAEQEAALAEKERATDPDELGYVPGQIVVVYEDDATQQDREEAVESLGAEQSEETAEFDAGDVTSLTIDEGKTVETAVREAQAEEAVKYAVPNYVVELFDEPAAETAGAIQGDDASSKQWYLDFIKAPAAWELLAEHRKVTKPVKVAVLDTGASLTHPDLENVINERDSAEVVWTDSSNIASWKAAPLRGDGYTNGGTTINDYTSHGTHVSGIIAGEAGNGGILGVASGGATANANKLVDLVVIDTFSLLKDNKPNASLVDLAFALTYARDAGCSIVNMSLGVPTTDEKVAAYFEQVCTELAEKNDMLVISAAGNSNTTATCYPAACDSVMGVISVSERRSVSAASRTFLNPFWGNNDEDVLRSYFSNYGDWCDISAPGEDIYSTYLARGVQNGYINMNGTSMACPVVVGVAALVKAADPSLKPQEIRDILCETATDLFTEGKDKQTGYGVVNAQAAVATALGLPAEAQEDAAPAVPSLKNAKVTVDTVTYTGGTQEPRVTVKMDGKTLVEDDDYNVRYDGKPKAAGSYPLSVEGHGNYSGSVPATFTIQPASVANADITVKSQTYTGKALKPAPTVMVRSVVLKKDTDYTVSYRNNTNAGTATVVVTGKGNYTGIATADFTIKPASLSGAGGTAASPSSSTSTPANQNSASSTPTPAPKPSTGTASPGPASGAVTTAPVNKAQSATKSGNPAAPVSVAKKNLAAAAVSGVAGTYTYTGKAISPYPVLRYNGALLRRGVDYTVGFRNNRALGTATVVMTGMGSYKGTLQMRFTIAAPTVQATKITKAKAGKKAFTVTWKRAAGKVSSYQLQYSTSKKFTKKTTKTLTVKASGAKTLSKSVKKLKAKKTYYVRVRTVYQVGDETFTSSWSSVKKVKTKR